MAGEAWKHGVFVFSPLPSGTSDLEKMRDELDRYGAAGWELISSLTTMNHGNTNGILFIFKRPA